MKTDIYLYLTTFTIIYIIIIMFYEFRQLTVIVCDYSLVKIMRLRFDCIRGYFLLVAV